ncbi:MAG: DUF1295 domain-containing protein, partial [Woeseia sp.]
MTELQIHNFLVLTTISLAGATFIALLSVNAPYGRHLRPGWGPTIPARIGWIVMESPAVLLFAAVYAIGAHAMSIAVLALFVLWQFHYPNRGLIFPFRMREAGKRMPVAIAAMAFVFSCLNAYINARWISHFGHYADAWLATVPFAFGLVLFLAGWAINQQADAVLIRLRQPGESGYRIPHGGFYRWVSCSNYLGEMLQWAGWALATWSAAGAAFALFTVANLLPRALAHHRWYRKEFPDYP